MKYIKKSQLAVLFVAVFMLPNAWAATLVVANKAEATTSLIDLDSGTVVATLPTGDGPHEVGISPDGQFAMVSNYGRRGNPGNSLTLIDIASASVVKTIDPVSYTHLTLPTTIKPCRSRWSRDA